MWTEIVKVIPRVDSLSLNNMEKLLHSRFANVAKKFGSGLVNVLKGGGIAGVAIALIDKVLNPLKEVQESIERSLSKGDDLATFAKQFNTTAGSLARLQAFGKATGLEPEGVRLLLAKFQAAVSQAALNPSQPSAVSNFVGKKDTAEAFFEFVQALQKLGPIQQNLVQQEVFGERQILKASEFLQADFKFLAEKIGGPSAEALTIAAEQLGTLKDMKDLLSAQRELKDLQTKAGLIGPRTITELNRGENIDLARENKRLGQFDDLKKISIAADKITKLLEDAYLKLAPVLATYLPKLIDQLATSAKIVEKSRSLRGLLPGQGKDK